MKAGLPHSSRRALLLSLLAGPAAWSSTGHAQDAAALSFPRDFGSHPDFATEWWYITGHARAGEREFGFQLTFFRSRIEATQTMRSAFAAKQLMFAHAAITDLEARRLRHDQRIARTGFGIASASELDTDLRLRDWSLRRGHDGSLQASLPADGFGIELRFAPTQPVLLQGDAGRSRKGPDAAQFSYYYSQPQLAARGALSVQGRRFEVEGRAWLDHEWSNAFLHPDAVGWDWIGMNLLDGTALMAFQVRRADGSALWTGGSMRSADGRLQVFEGASDPLRFEALAHWTSPRTHATYPIRWRIATPAGGFEVRALLDDQELDGQGSTGSVYWEGLSELLDAAGRVVGRGYLELTGYARPLKL